MERGALMVVCLPSLWVKEARSSAGPGDQEPNVQVQGAVEEFFRSDVRQV